MVVIILIICIVKGNKRIVKIILELYNRLYKIYVGYKVK